MEKGSTPDQSGKLLTRKGDRTNPIGAANKRSAENQHRERRGVENQEGVGKLVHSAPTPATHSDRPRHVYGKPVARYQVPPRARNVVGPPGVVCVITSRVSGGYCVSI
ncbi:hypothetical protein KC19_2G213400 [Ceratodon purpureus]|uniref:Uncharacterized protein n=1 Tax=Ceratodon purpureus TaxID=3225 RepID=A0A8T0IZA7_CERPU|nr:hypothetical protein KC19_2G213400 [Ceratodon purpureus]